jgi:hypothetical protein
MNINVSEPEILQVKNLYSNKFKNFRSMPNSISSIQSIYTDSYPKSTPLSLNNNLIGRSRKNFKEKTKNSLSMNRYKALVIDSISKKSSQKLKQYESTGVFKPEVNKLRRESQGNVILNQK